MKVLIAEDDVVSRRVLEAFLKKWGYEVIATSNGAEASVALDRHDAPRLALLDWMMPELDGVELCRRIRSRNDPHYLYILLLTAKSQKQDLLEALDAGADDYLTKPFDVQELRARLRVGQRILEMQDELIAAREVLRYQATHDPLTGLWNRREILESLNREVARGGRGGGPVGILLADLDHFKSVNDHHGHLVGDSVLRETSRRLAASLRTYDAVGRYGGEEFLVVVPGADPAGLASLAERIRRSIADPAMRSPTGPLAVTASIGVALASSARVEDAAALVAAADAALYRAKAAGRNRVEVAVESDFTAVFVASLS